MDWNGVPNQELSAFLGTNGTWDLELADASDTPHLVLYYQVWIDGQCVHNAPGPGTPSGIGFSASSELTVGLKDLLEPDRDGSGDAFPIFLSHGGGHTEILGELPKETGATTWIRREPLSCAQTGADVVLLNHVTAPGRRPIHFDETGKASAVDNDGTKHPLEERTGIVIRLRVL